MLVDLRHFVYEVERFATMIQTRTLSQRYSILFYPPAYRYLYYFKNLQFLDSAIPNSFLLNSDLACSYLKGHGFDRECDSSFVKFYGKDKFVVYSDEGAFSYYFAFGSNLYHPFDTRSDEYRNVYVDYTSTFL